MASRSHTNLSIIEAVETLSSIADLEFDREIGIAQRHEIVLQDEKIAYKTVHWLHEKDASETVTLVRDTFRVILHYLRHFYKKEYGFVTDPKTIEGIKTIMVLVGEAAKKLDKYTNLFQQAHQKSITECKEYKQLQEFYLSKIARKIDEGVLGKWILGLSLSKIQRPTVVETTLIPATKEIKLPDTKHVFVDLESVKKDTEYELFFIRKEDGSRYFSPRLLRNIKLVCDFGSYFGERKGLDPLENVRQWLDRVLHDSARSIIKSLGHHLDHYYQELAQVSNQEIITSLNKTLIALMMSSHSNNLLRHDPLKCCAEYFDDFQLFLRETLQTSTYQRWLAYPPNANDVLAHDVLEMIQTMCRTLYSGLHGLEDLVSIVQSLIHESTHQQSPEHQKEVEFTKRKWNRLASDYSAMVKLLKRHPNGPLFKVLELLEANSYQFFDPLMQHNLPNSFFDLFISNKRVENLRFAAPVVQELITKAQVNDEFKGFLRSYQANEGTHLLINLQDRTSWMEHARAVALEELQNHGDLKDVVRVVTLAADTDFYHQLAPYNQMNHADIFIEQFKEHLKGEGSGFYFPSTLNKEELNAFIDRTLKSIHKVFFSNKNVLLREHRLDFIEIFYLFLILKLIEMTQPTSFSLTCKDGIDIGPLHSAEMFIFLKMLNENTAWSEREMEYLNFMLYGPALLIRERVVLPERFNRMISAIKALENTQHELKDQFGAYIQREFGPLFKSPILQSLILLP